MPLSNARVIPEAWSRHHAPTTTGGMNATVTIGSKDGDPIRDGDDVVQPYTNDYTGPARIQALNQAHQAELAGEPLNGRAYLVQIDMATATADFAPSMRVLVTAAINDAQLVDQELWIVDPQLGSERFTRDLVCSDNQTDTP